MWRVTPEGWTFLEFSLLLFASAVIGFVTGFALNAAH